ncbi:Glyco transf 10 domain containing protein [Trichuris trichiura]|uniref:Fucosyltransferase n=1 Tax=Trichuris trichiura TaxID=36087 RepID=A0A077ZGZ9_TRITR|nr:Glyco transf 10 domain containing protein [Trichuris trichiura]
MAEPGSIGCICIRKLQQPKIQTIFVLLLIISAIVYIRSPQATLKDISYIFANRTNDSITILMWFGYFSSRFDQSVFSDCPELNCFVTHNRSYFEQSSAVIFHDRSIVLSELPRSRLPGQHYVFFLMESPHYTSVKPYRKLSKHFYTLTMNYRRDADIQMPFGYMMPRKKILNLNFWDDLRKIVAKKTKLACWFVSNCDTSSKREVYMRNLQKYFPVDVYGECGPLKCSRDNPHCRTLQKSYKFHFVFENSVCTDFVTGRFFDALIDVSIPIVLKRKIYEPVGPKNSFIAADDFASPKEMADYLLRLANDTEAYIKYFEWMRHYESIGEERSHAKGFCQLCRKLKQMRQYNECVSASKTAKDIMAWYNVTKHCYPGYGSQIGMADRKLHEN